MLWLSRPPLLAPAVATVLVATALWSSVAPPAMVDHPFASVDHAPGDRLRIQVRRIPEGMLPTVPVPIDARASRAVGEGDPILPADLGASIVVPDGWWTVSVDLPAGARLGDRALLVVAGWTTEEGSASMTVEGVVTALGSDDPFGATAPGTVAIPPGPVAAVADAAMAGRLVVLTGR